LIINTLAKKIDESFSQIRKSQIVVVWNSSDERSSAKVMPKKWGMIQLTNVDGLARLTSKNGGSCIELNFPFDDCSITLRVPELTLLIVGNLDFFADAIGKHGTCGWLCLY
jgi:hypothetical protein